MTRLHKQFPPGLGHIQLPVSSREAAAAGITMYAACKRHTQWLQALAWTLTRLFGPRILPGRTEEWIPPVRRDMWEELMRVLEREFGAFSDCAVRRRRQQSRTATMLLLFKDNKPTTFVKLSTDGGPLLHEYEVLHMVRRANPVSFFVPKPLGVGSVDGIHFMATEPLPAYPHRVAERPPLTEIVSEIEDALKSLPRSADVPPTWRPIHGDFSPWNLRMFDRHGLALYDWEDAGWGPPHADEVLYVATSAALGRRLELSHSANEAVHFWRARYARSGGENRDALIEKIDRVLVEMIEQGDSPSFEASERPQNGEDAIGQPDGGTSFADADSPEQTGGMEAR